MSSGRTTSWPNTSGSRPETVAENHVCDQNLRRNLASVGRPLEPLVVLVRPLGCRVHDVLCLHVLRDTRGSGIVNGSAPLPPLPRDRSGRPCLDRDCELRPLVEDSGHRLGHALRSDPATVVNERTDLVARASAMPYHVGVDLADVGSRVDFMRGVVNPRPRRCPPPVARWRPNKATCVGRRAAGRPPVRVSARAAITTSMPPACCHPSRRPRR